jgi:tetratricopeptide (TPR) repeat protein
MYKKDIILHAPLTVVLIVAIVLVTYTKIWSQDKSKEVQISNDPYIESAATHRKRGEYEEAVLNAEKAIEIDPQDPRGYGILADIYRRQGRYSEAIEQYKKVMELEPTSIPNLFGMVRLLDEASGIDDAIQYLSEWIHKNPHHSSLNEAEGLLENLKNAKTAGKKKFFE